MNNSEYDLITEESEAFDNRFENSLGLIAGITSVSTPKIFNITNDYNNFGVNTFEASLGIITLFTVASTTLVLPIIKWNFKPLGIALVSGLTLTGAFKGTEHLLEKNSFDTSKITSDQIIQSTPLEKALENGLPPKLDKILAFDNL